MTSTDALAHAAREVEHLRGVVVAARDDGRLVATWRRDDETWDAPAAAEELAVWAGRAPETLLGNGAATVFVEHDGGTLVVRSVGDNAVGVLFDAHAPIGMARLYADRVVGALHDIGFAAEVTEIRDSAAHAAVPSPEPYGEPREAEATRDLSSDAHPAVAAEALDEVPAHATAPAGSPDPSNDADEERAELMDEDEFFDVGSGDDGAIEEDDAMSSTIDAGDPAQPAWSTDPSALLKSDAFRDSGMWNAAGEPAYPEHIDEPEPSPAADDVEPERFSPQDTASAEPDVAEASDDYGYHIDEVGIDMDVEVDMDASVDEPSLRVDPAAFDDARVATGAEPVLPADDPFAIDPPAPDPPAPQAPLRPLALSAVEAPKGPPPLPKDPPTIPIPDDVLNASRHAARPPDDTVADEVGDVPSYDRETVPMKPFTVDRLERLRQVRDEVEHQMTPPPVDSATLDDAAAVEIRALLAELTAAAPDGEVALLRVALRARVGRARLDAPEQLQRDEINRVRAAAEVVAEGHG